MKITFVADKIDPAGGGSNQTIDLLCRFLLDRGHDVTVVTLNPVLNDLPDDLAYDVIESDIEMLPTRIGIATSVTRVLRRYAGNSDIFQIFNPFYHTGGGLYRYLGGETPVFGYLSRYSFCTNLSRMDDECYRSCSTRKKFKHSNAGLWKNIAKFPLYAYATHLEPLLLNAVDKYVAISPCVRDIFAEVGIKRTRMEVVPLCFDPEFETGTARTRQTGESPLRVLFVGRLHRMKGVDILLDGVAKAETDVLVEIVGDGPEKTTLEQQAERIGLTDQISFQGHIPNDELAPYYRLSDVFVHPCRFPEPFGRTILEALQTNTPLIVSDLGAPQWVAGDAGRVFENDCPASLASVLDELAIKKDQLEGLKRACDDRCQNFSPDYVIGGLETLYRSVFL